MNVVSAMLPLKGPSKQNVPIAAGLESKSIRTMITHVRGAMGRVSSPTNN